ncbi:hypothetical protein K435DRAFT_853312 [Dendrothele bispora CBS 962.96]|uniref:Late embryogenesis abundant protein LEA-2 subgroup domain-containing protein n=1 Tax=Dendrothele bispora (strain CBS 962.96) TaxID=1314807 RepID=A0A4S8MGX1_DENBC|nr:hypothetical protein K435DRAFT_853312 [Dendrothele bispora CBS 962.96]
MNSSDEHSIHGEYATNHARPSNDYHTGLSDVQLEAQVTQHRGSTLALVERDVFPETEKNIGTQGFLERIQDRLRSGIVGIRTNRENVGGRNSAAEVDHRSLARNVLWEVSEAEEELPSDIREYRQRRSQGLWRKGSRLQRISRYSCLAQLISIYISISIFMSLVLVCTAFDLDGDKVDEFISPLVAIGNISLDTSKEVLVDNTSVTVPLSILISVENPNYISATLTEVNVAVSYPLNTSTSIPVGNGSLSSSFPPSSSSSSIDIKSNTRTNFSFPFFIDISFNAEQNLEVLADLLGRCGDLRNQSGIDLVMDLKVKLHVLGIHLSPSSSRPTTIACPFNQTNLDNILQGLQNALGDVIHGENPSTLTTTGLLPGFTLPSAFPVISFSFPNLVELPVLSTPTNTPAFVS